MRSCRLLALAFILPSLSASFAVPSAGDRHSFRFEGEVSEGELFARGCGEELALLLRPTSTGWLIDVRDDRGTKDLSVWTTPWRGINARDLSGWHFRNSDNTGPNETGPRNVNAPQEERRFIFSPEVRRTITPPGGSARPSREELERIREHGRGTLTILDYRLAGLKAGERARFTWLRFRVELSWPAE